MRRPHPGCARRRGHPPSPFFVAGTARQPLPAQCSPSRITPLLRHWTPLVHNRQVTRCSPLPLPRVACQMGHGQSRNAPMAGHACRRGPRIDLAGPCSRISSRTRAVKTKQRAAPSEFIPNKIGDTATVPVSRVLSHSAGRHSSHEARFPRPQTYYYYLDHGPGIITLL